MMWFLAPMKVNAGKMAGFIRIANELRQKVLELEPEMTACEFSKLRDDPPQFLSLRATYQRRCGGSAPEYTSLSCPRAQLVPLH